MHRVPDEGPVAVPRAGGHLQVGSRDCLLGWPNPRCAHVLFMSGHLGNAYAEDVTLTEGSFLPKPFAAADLRDALDKVSAVQEPRPPPDPAAGTPHSSG